MAGSGDRATRRGSFVDGVLRLWVTAPPIEGRANLEARQLIAEALGLPRADVVIESGSRGRDKVVSFPDVPAERLATLRELSATTLRGARGGRSRR